MITKINANSVFIFIFILFLWGYCAYAESTAVVIKSQNLSAYNETVEGFKSECSKNDIDVKALYDIKGKTKIGHKIIRKIKKEKPDVILTIGVLATAIVKDEIKDIPIIFCLVINHERFQLSGDNITGIANEISIEKQLEGYKVLLNSLRNIGVIYDPSKTGNIIENAEVEMKEVGINLVEYEIKSPKMVSEALENLTGNIDALWLLPDSTVVTKKTFEFIKSTTLENNIPLLCTSEVFVKAGALAAVFSDYRDIGRQAAQLAKKLPGISPTRSLGVIPPDKFKLAINSNTAEKLGLKLEAVQGKPYVIMYP